MDVCLGGEVSRCVWWRGEWMCGGEVSGCVWWRCEWMCVVER